MLTKTGEIGINWSCMSLACDKLHDWIVTCRQEHPLPQVFESPNIWSGLVNTSPELFAKLSTNGVGVFTSLKTIQQEEQRIKI